MHGSRAAPPQSLVLLLFIPSKLSKMFYLTRFRDQGPLWMGPATSHIPGNRRSQRNHFAVCKRRNSPGDHVAKCIVNKNGNTPEGKMEHMLESQGSNSSFSLPELKNCLEIASETSLLWCSSQNPNCLWPPLSQRVKHGVCFLNASLQRKIPAGILSVMTVVWLSGWHLLSHAHGVRFVDSYHEDL